MEPIQIDSSTEPDDIQDNQLYILGDPWNAVTFTINLYCIEMIKEGNDKQIEINTYPHNPRSLLKLMSSINYF